MNDDYLPPKQPSPNTSSDIEEQETTVDRVFDISADGISPVTGDWRSPDATKDTVTQPPITKEKVAPPTKPGRPYIPPDTNLLDDKIGTFDASPFAAKPATQPSTEVPQRSSIPVPPIPKDFVPAMNSNLPPLSGKASNKTAPSQKPTPTTPGQPIMVPKKPAPIPIQDFSASLNKAQSSTDAPRKNLQDEIASTLGKSAPIPTQNISLVASTSVPKMPENLSSDSVKPVRTYETDVAEAMSHKRPSQASMVIAESRRQEGTDRIGSENAEPATHGIRKLIMTLLSLALLGGGAVGAYYLYTLSPLAPVKQIEVPQSQTQNIVPADSQALVLIDSSQPLMAQSRIQAEVEKPQAPKTIKEIVIGTKDATGATQRVNAATMLSIMDIDAPNILARTLLPTWMLGVYADELGQKSVFVAVTTNFFQNAFAGMLQWESVMADDLKLYLYPSPLQGISNTINAGTRVPIDPFAGLESILPSSATTTATTTSSSTMPASPNTTNAVASSTVMNTTASTSPETVEPLRPYFTLRGAFEDRIIKNKDARQFRTVDGTTLFLYSFIDNSHLIVTSSEAALAEIIDRIGQQSFIR